MKILLLLLMLLMPSIAHATSYYISPTGSNSNDGLSTGAPFLTFAHAINASRAWCGDTLHLLNGTYGDGTSTGKISANAVVCTAGNELIVTALNQRKAKIFDNGTGRAVQFNNSAYIIVDGLYLRSTDNSGGSGGNPIRMVNGNHYTVRNNVVVNPNRYNNLHAISIHDSTDSLVEDNEVYTYGRHCVELWRSERIVVRRQYCNPRGGAISGGVGPGVGRADAVVSMYPCTNCIAENIIMDGTTHGGYLVEQNSPFFNSILMHGSSVLGSICYKCTTGNGIYANARSNPGLNYTPKDGLLQDIAIVDYAWQSTGIRCSSCVNYQINRITVLGTGVTGQDGITLDDFDNVGATPSENSATITNSVVSGVQDLGYTVTQITNWSGSNNLSNGNGTAYNPSLPSNWGSSTTANPGFGTCKGLWAPDGSAAETAGAGARILYRYVDGVLLDGSGGTLQVPLWDPTTAEFPHGEADLDGVNRVAGESLFDFHVRMNVNTGGCPFPSSFSSGGGGAPTNPPSHHRTTDLDGAHTRTISASANRGLTVFLTTIWNGVGTQAFPTSVTSSCGSEDIPPLATHLFTDTTAGHRSVRVFGLVNPTSGTCTLTPTFSTTVNGGWIMESVEESNIGSYGAVAQTVGVSVTPTVTSNSNADEITRTFVGTGTGSTVTLSAGPHQTLTTDHQHPSVSLRIGSSTQSGADGQEESFLLGGLRAWGIVAVPIVPPSPGGPGPSAFEITAYRIEGLHGQAANNELSLGPLCLDNEPARIGPNGAFRVRFKVAVVNDTSVPTGVAPYCRENAGEYIRVQNTFNGRHIAYYGTTAEPTIPGTGTPTSQRFAGTFAPGSTARNDTIPIILPAMPAGTHTEIDYQLTSGNSVTRNTSFTCILLRDDGSALGTYTVPLPLVLVQDPQSSMGH
ncbi:MAG: hypothetical protein OEY77_00205 [Nitrospira sp.]|nr:hypothetical protein [Nitrospira sp.]